jgi:hypothetical protein
LSLCTKEAEQFLVTELKKLEAANARMTATRGGLQEVDAALAAAIAAAADRVELKAGTDG